MGEQIRWSVSVDKETDAIAEILQRTYAEYVGSNRSRLVQFLFKRFHRMAGNLAAALEQEQRIKQAISCEEITTLNNSSQQFPSIAPELGQMKPLTRAVSKAEARQGRRLGNVSRRSYGEALLAMSSLSFPGIGGNPWDRKRPYKSNTYNGLRVA